MEVDDGALETFIGERLVRAAGESALDRADDGAILRHAVAVEEFRVAFRLAHRLLAAVLGARAAEHSRAVDRQRLKDHQLGAMRQDDDEDVRKQVIDISEHPLTRRSAGATSASLRMR